MRLKNILAVLAILFYYSALAQSDEVQEFKFYARVFGSYGFFTGGSFKAPASTSTVSQNGTSSYGFNAQKNGMGAGVRFGAGFGIIVSKAINIGIDVEYLSGTKLTSTSSTQLNDSILINSATPNASATTTASDNYQLSHTILSIIPSITFKAITTENYYIYTRVGIIIGIPLKIDVTDTSHSLYITSLPAVTPPGYNYSTEIASNSAYNYKSNPGIGYQAALGIAFKISSNMRFYGEVVSNSLTLHPVEYDETYHTTTTTKKFFNGADVTTIDHTLNIQQFKQSGTSTISYTGTYPNQVAYYQSPQISMAINSLNV